ncbi:MAG: hypothetical protein HC838_09750 [Spirulinaceae cyanobacterium RM2_2_10]|nr:hypothetical protein [Spirulinaceae cyanobacterium RM2_2_10]
MAVIQSLNELPSEDLEATADSEVGAAETTAASETESWDKGQESAW